MGPSPTPTLTAAPARELDCKLNWQSPGDWYKVRPLREFSTGWKVTNTGTSTWDSESVEFTYLEGAKLHEEATVRLPSSVPPGSSVILSVGMRAPRNPSIYTTYWSLRQESIFFCRVALTIRVE